MSIAAAYETDGFVVVPGIFSSNRMAAIKASAIRELESLDKLKTPSGVNVWMADEVSGDLKAAVLDVALTRIVKSIIGDATEFLSVKTVFKSRDKRFASPWHQDWFYWKGAPKLSAWIALDPATPENGCLRLYPATHTREFPMIQIDSGPGFGLQIDPRELEDLEPIDVPVGAGDVVFFHDLAVHGSHENRSGQDRWSLIATYRDSREPDDSTVWKKGIPLT